jgi:Zn-dependent peptidase ImmA (M78 family)
MNDFDGLPKSTYYYRKKHPPKLSFAVIAREYGVTRQCIYIFAKRNGITDPRLLRTEYWLHQQEIRKQREKARAKYAPCYAEYEIIASEPCEKDYIRPEKQSRKNKRQNIIRLLQEESK